MYVIVINHAEEFYRNFSVQQSNIDGQAPHNSPLSVRTRRHGSKRRTTKDREEACKREKRAVREGESRDKTGDIADILEAHSA